MLQKVIFLDRDGVINRDSSDYIKNWAEFEFLPGSRTAIRHLTSNGFTLFIITNQSIINRRMTSREDLEYTHTMMKRAIKAREGEIKDIFYCPHTPDEGCKCRKPEPGLIYMAQKTYRIDLSTAIMVGDSAKDIECARNAGCGQAILVKTGNCIEAERILRNKKILPDHIALNLYEAATWIINKGIRYVT